ncbi:hypothetical protein K435DRAFT_840646 [Dendrothele bispora CBS 962.96]|uniref:DUF6533 domain-containing protein n=1 Tax=Dendrothele bispora (strain CBS 962.96) TaxID=1314807 RepID=A0A4S8LS15_DENBC|nr:hypothetical protein K435DRAFT_840646 [Dendrothele bispora CBS 962.96]
MDSDSNSRLVLFLDAHQVVLYLEVASFALWVHDYLISFDDEIQLVWQAPWKLGKVLFLFTRYIVLVRMIVTIYIDQARFLPMNQCKGLSQTSSVLTFLGLYTSEIILSLRLWAVWGRSRWIAALLVVGCLMPVAGIAMYSIIKDKYDVSDFFVQVYDSAGICPSYLNGIESVIRLFIYLVVLEALIFILTVYKAAEHWWLRGFSASSLVETFFKDGLLYNIIVLLTSTVNIALRSTTESIFMADTLLAFQMVIHSVLTSRMLLHLRRAALGDVDLSRVLESIRFASNPEQTLSTGQGAHTNTRLSPMDEVQSWFGDGLQGTESQPVAGPSSNVMREIHH